LAAAASLFSALPNVTPETRPHDDFHRDRMRAPTAGETHRRRLKAKRRRRNRIAFESRRRNWAV